VHALYRPHSTVTAGVLVIAAGIYELTPMKSRCRRRCRTASGSGEFAFACLGSSIVLMAAFIALGLMSVTWMVIAAVVMVVQKIFPAQYVVDVPVALAIVSLGVLAVATPQSIPGLMSSM
jgi:predicted metal-binding membrane protein